jgi:hypothetical protein
MQAGYLSSDAAQLHVAFFVPFGARVQLAPRCFAPWLCWWVVPVNVVLAALQRAWAGAVGLSYHAICLCSQKQHTQRSIRLLWGGGGEKEQMLGIPRAAGGRLLAMCMRLVVGAEL